MKYLKFLFLLSGLCYAISIWQVSSLPDSKEIQSDLSNDPIQILKQNEEKFILDYKGDEYLIEPVATYDITGMIVSHNNIQALDDIYHNSNSVDVRDLCLIWGRNAENDNHLHFNFKNEPFSCHINQKDNDPDAEFRMENLSNNHLLVSSLKLRDQIYSLHPGDQVRLKGWLINYGDKIGEPYRRTSLVRSDDGNGACEVMYVEDVEVLARWNSKWWKIRSIFSKTTLVLGILYFLSLFAAPIISYELRKRDTNLMEKRYKEKYKNIGSS